MLIVLVVWVVAVRWLVVACLLACLLGCSGCLGFLLIVVNCLSVVGWFLLFLLVSLCWLCAVSRGARRRGPSQKHTSALGLASRARRLSGEH